MRLPVGPTIRQFNDHSARPVHVNRSLNHYPLMKGACFLPNPVARTVVVL
ncbi:hypothetical protein ACOMQX_000185 [Enterobacter ludwigii]